MNVSRRFTRCVAVPTPASSGRRWVALALAAVLAGVSAGPAFAQGEPHDPSLPPVVGPELTAEDPPEAPIPKAECGPGSRPETARQGQVPLADHVSGRAPQGYTCNTEMLGRFGTTGGYRVERYVDGAGHECAFYDTKLLFPANITAGTNLTGTFVLDMTNPSNPVKTANLLTPAMESPHESLRLNTKRGLLVAVTANPVFYPGVIDIYDVTADCRNPALKASLPVGLLGHESGFAPDGNTFYTASLDGGTITAVDVKNPMTPTPLWVGQYRSHGLSIRDDGRRAYVAARGGLIILDTSQIQDRVPNPTVTVVSQLAWPKISTPQNALPVTIGGRRFLIEIDEFAKGGNVGAARIIDIADETKPKVISNMKLEVNMTENRASQMADPGASSGLQGYAGHYCEVPQEIDPGIVACTFIVSGLRVFDIRDPYNPREIAYFNAPLKPSSTGGNGSNYAMAAPDFVPERGEIWYSDGNQGFFAVKLTNGVWPFAEGNAASFVDDTGNRVAGLSPESEEIPATGGVPVLPLGVLFAMTLLAVLAVYPQRRARQLGPRTRASRTDRG
ncbi:MAG: LVIVD repeat-containing protein [Acidimicrobiales bacterium]